MTMTTESLLKSTFETYLLDEEMELETVEQEQKEQVEERTKYPSGFFSSL